MNDNIVLIGFMGSGKTTFGKWISRKYGYSFCDTDEYIEKKEKKKWGGGIQGYGNRNCKGIR